MYVPWFIHLCCLGAKTDPRVDDDTSEFGIVLGKIDATYLGFIAANGPPNQETLASAVESLLV